MRIESNPELQQAADSERTSGQPSASANRNAPQGSSTLAGDLTELSGFHYQIQSLAAQLSALPETASQRVAALREAVVSGRYKPSPEQVARALFSNMVGKIAA